MTFSVPIPHSCYSHWQQGLLGPRGLGLHGWGTGTLQPPSSCRAISPGPVSKGSAELDQQLQVECTGTQEKAAENVLKNDDSGGGVAGINAWKILSTSCFGAE